MLENYFWLGLGLLLLIVGVFSFFKPEVLITKNTPKKHPIFGVGIKKYNKMRAPVMIILGLIMVIIQLFEIFGK